MTFLSVTTAVVTALLIGYVAGRRSGAKTQTWSQRTNRAALGRQALSLLALLAARRLQRSLERRLPTGGTRQLSRLIRRS